MTWSCEQDIYQYEVSNDEMYPERIVEQQAVSCSATPHS